MNDSNKKAMIVVGIMFLIMFGVIGIHGTSGPVSNSTQTAVTQSDSTLEKTKQEEEKKKLEENKKKEEQLKAEKERQEQEKKQQAIQYAQTTIDSILSGLNQEYDSVEHVTWYKRPVSNEYISYYVGKNDSSDSYFIRIIGRYIEKGAPGEMGPSIESVTFSSSFGTENIKNYTLFESKRAFKVKSDNLELHQLRVGYSLHDAKFDVVYDDIPNCVKILAAGENPVVRWYDRLHDRNRDYQLNNSDIQAMNEALKLHDALYTLKSFK